MALPSWTSVQRRSGWAFAEHVGWEFPRCSPCPSTAGRARRVPSCVPWRPTLTLETSHRCTCRSSAPTRPRSTCTRGWGSSTTTAITIESEQERKPRRKCRVSHAHGQRHSIAQPQATTAIDRGIGAGRVLVIFELDRHAWLAEHRPVFTEPKIPLHNDWDPDVVSRVVDAEAQAYAVVDASDEALLREHHRAEKADARKQRSFT